MNPLHAHIKADEITELRPRGYRHTERTWAVVSLGNFEIVAVDDEGIAGMQRLIDALTTAVAQARQAEADETLTALPLAGTVA